MKNLFFVFFVISSLCSSLLAQTFMDWIPLNRLIKESDLIVSGTLRSVSRHTNNGVDYSEGTIVVEEFISGDVKITEGSPLKKGDKIKLTWQNSSAQINCRVELGGSENNEVIWILKVKSDGTVTADNYFSIRSADTNSLREIKEISQKEKPRKNLQIIKSLNLITDNQDLQSESSKPLQNHIAEIYDKDSKYSLLSALIIILFSLGFYWILYRSRFRIR